MRFQLAVLPFDERLQAVLISIPTAAITACSGPKYIAAVVNTSLMVSPVVTCGN